MFCTPYFVCLYFSRFYRCLSNAGEIRPFDWITIFWNFLNTPSFPGDRRNPSTTTHLLWILHYSCRHDIIFPYPSLYNIYPLWWFLVRYITIRPRWKNNNDTSEIIDNIVNTGFIGKFNENKAFYNDTKWK